MREYIELAVGYRWVDKDMCPLHAIECSHKKYNFSNARCPIAFHASFILAWDAFRVSSYLELGTNHRSTSSSLARSGVSVGTKQRPASLNLPK